MWKYKNQELSEESIPKEAIGFIYKIKQLSTGKQYIGKKLLTKAATKTVKGVKKKIRKESDWKTYYSSSPFLQELVAEVGEADFEREILVFCNSKSSLTYCEEMTLFMLGVLENQDQYFNSNIRSKMYANWVKGKQEIKELRDILSSEF